MTEMQKSTDGGTGGQVRGGLSGVLAACADIQPAPRLPAAFVEVVGRRRFRRDVTKAKTQDLDEEVDMYNTILVPLDGSKRAEAILPHVEDLAGRYGATVIFLRVVEPVPLNVGLEGAYTVLGEEFERRIEQAESYLAALQGEYREKEIEVRIRVVHGSAVEAIMKTADREGADLIAIASHGRSGLPQVFYGSVAAGVLHRVDRPLLLIRSR
jgi:nucleotide-binding universal stress UspA family protein